MASVVIAEDNLEHQRAIAEVVRRLGHEINVAADGRAALVAVAEHRPDLVIADVDMPQFDGLQLCRAMRADPRLAQVPVVLITAYLTPGDPSMTDAGAAAVVGKPFSTRELTDAVRAQLDADPPAVDGVAEPTATPDDATVGDAAPAVAPPSGGLVLEPLLDSLDAAVVTCDVHGRLTTVNPTLRMLLGEDSGTVPVQDWPQRFGLCHPDGAPLRPDEMPLVRALAGEHVHRVGLLLRDFRGRPRWLSVNARPVRDGSDLLLGAVAAVHDVTVEHRTRVYRDCQAEVLRILAEPDAGTRERVLAAVATALGWPHLRLWLVDPVGDRLRPTAAHTVADREPPPAPPALARGEALPGLCWQRGEAVWVPDVDRDSALVPSHVHLAGGYRAAGAVPILDGEAVAGVLTFLCDDPQEPEPALSLLLTAVAGHLGADLARRRADELARQLTESTEEYTALVGHELRTPLTSIAAYTDLLVESPGDTPIGEVRDLLEVVVRNSARLRHLVDQLLDLATLESDHWSLTPVGVDLVAVVTAAVDAVADTARARRITIHTDLPDTMPLVGDPNRLRQVVDHLLANAVAYGPDGSTVTVAGRADSTMAEVTVADCGEGIPADELPLVFRRLYRGGNARYAGVPGAGLGLALSRIIVARHRGTITLSPGLLSPGTFSPGRPGGTVATVRLPVAVAPGATGVGAPPATCGDDVPPG